MRTLVPTRFFTHHVFTRHPLRSADWSAALPLTADGSADVWMP